MGRRYVSLEQYNNIRKEVDKANKRIRRIQAKYGDKAWAVANLTEKLDRQPLINAINPYSGEIKLNKSMSDATLNAVRSATNEFLKSKTSTLRGIKEAKENMIASLKSSLSTDNIQLTDKEAQALYRIVEDKNLRDTAEYIGASQLWDLMIEAKVKRASEDEWYKMLLDYNAFGKDLDMKNDLQRIYDEYIAKK
jgi:hypothetical protein